MTVSDEEDVADLKNKFKEACSNRLDYLAADSLVVWRYKDQEALKDIDDDALGEKLKSIIFDDPNTIEKLGNARKRLTEFGGTSQDELLFVQMPGSSGKSVTQKRGIEVEDTVSKRHKGENHVLITGISQ